MCSSFDIDAPCGRHFRFRDFVECGATWRRLATLAAADPIMESIDNVPRQEATYRAISRLCEVVLDLVIDTFGAVELTYGFASPRLTRHIRRHIAPHLDQHAGHELNGRGKPICSRLGQAVDFRVPGRDGLEVARWLAGNTAFDRLYLYGAERPIHVSVGPDGSRLVVVMGTSPQGRRYPRRTSGAAEWLESARRS